MATKKDLINVVNVINDYAPVTKAQAKDIALRVMDVLHLEISANEFCYPVFDDPDQFFCSTEGCSSWARKFAFPGKEWEKFWFSHYVERHL